MFTYPARYSENRLITIFFAPRGQGNTNININIFVPFSVRNTPPPPPLPTAACMRLAAPLCSQEAVEPEMEAERGSGV